MYEIVDDDGETLAKRSSLKAAHEFCKSKWPTCWFDGDVSHDISEQYVYVSQGDDDVCVCKIELPKDDDNED